MAKEFQLRISIPNSICVDQKVLQVNLPTISGYIGILPEHTPIVGSLTPGFVHIKFVDGSIHTGLVNYGLYYFKDNRLVILSDFFEFSCHGVDVSALTSIQQRIEEETKKVELSTKTIGLLNSFMKLASAKAKENNKRK